MRRRIELTEKEKQWLIDNYPTMRQCECAKHLMVSVNIIRSHVNELGLHKVRKPSGKKKSDKKKPSVSDGDKGYCIDCMSYVVGGICGRTGRYTGALNRKVCFKDNKS